MITFFPKFWYSGSKKWNIESDKPFIEKHLIYLTPDLQKQVSEQYEEIYKRHFNAGEYRLARYNANKHLQDFARENWNYIPNQNQERGSNQNPKQHLVEKCKKAQRENRPKIYLRSKRESNNY